jgi:hypothetical protein
VWIDGIDQVGKLEFGFIGNNPPGDKVFRIAAPGKKT